MLIVGAQIVKEIRDDIFTKLGYKCSAGIANNKVECTYFVCELIKICIKIFIFDLKTLAKLCCGINKPNKQTILPLNATHELLDKTQIQKMYEI
jgi:DNA polymerase eta